LKTLKVRLQSAFAKAKRLSLMIIIASLSGSVLSRMEKARKLLQ
jgi:hypothetical protein